MYDVRAYNRLYIGSSTSNLNINYDQIWRPDGGQIHIGYSAANNIQLNNGGGYTYSLTSLRAPVFYNYSNTGYYADFDSTGTSINIAGSLNAATYNKPGLLVNASGTSSSGGALGIQQVTSEGWTGIFVDFEPYTGWGLWHDNPNNYFSFTAEASTGQIRSFIVPSRQSGNRTAYEKFRIDQNNGDVIIGRDGYAQSSFRAPIFYDSDTSYYLDPNGTTNIRYLKVNTTGTSSGTRALTIKSDGQGEINFGSYPASWTSALQIQNNNNSDFVWISPLDDGYNARFRTAGTGLDFYTDGGNNTGTYSGFIGSGYVQGIDSIRGPIFYDSNDTTYRVDPNGDSRIWQLGIGYGLPGKRLDVIGDHGNSAMRVQLPASNNGAGTGMVALQMWASEPGNTWDWGGFGYNVDNSLNSGTNTYYFGRPNTNFGQAYMRFSTAGHTYFYNTNTSGTRSTNMEMYSSGYIYVNNYLEAGNSLRAPIFYDSDNTGYYGNFAGTSRISSLETIDRVVIGGRFDYNAYSSVNSTRLHFGGGDSDANGNYYIGTNKENYGGNYTKLDLRWHTGIRMGAQSGYGGIRMYDSEDLGTMLFSVGRSSSDVEVTYNLRVGGEKAINSRNMHVGSFTNLATAEDWVVSTGSNNAALGGGFGQNGDGNSVIQDFDPWGRPSLVWRTLGNDTSSNADGGWNKGLSNLDGNKSYMYVVYVKRDSSSTNGTYYFGCSGGETLNMSGSANGNPYFHAFGIGSLPQGVWCVAIGYVFANNHSSTGSTGRGGVWRLDTGDKIAGSTDYKMRYTGTRGQTHRTYLYYSTDPAAHLKWWGPGVYEINGNEPNLGELSGGVVVEGGQNINGQLTVQGNLFADRYYDRNNTSYYGDFASTSYVNDWRANIVYDREDTGYYFGSGAGDTRVRTLSTTGQIFIENGDPTIYFRDSNHRSAMLHNNSNIFYVLRGSGNNSTSWSTYNGYWPMELNLNNNDATFGGSVTAIYSMFAQTYYDRDNTGYYMNPNGVTNLGASNGPVLEVTKYGSAPGNNVTMIVRNQYGNHSWGITGEFRTEASGGGDRPSILFSSGLTGTTWSVGYGYADDNFRINRNHGYRNGGWGTTRMLVDTGSTTYFYDTIRFPFAYDIDNTGYYVDMNSTSRMNYVVPNRIKLVNNVNNEPRWDFSAYVVEAQHWYGNYSTQTMYLGESNVVYMPDIRPYIMYDRNDTGYYSDPASTNRTNYTLSNDTRIINDLYLDQQYGSQTVGVYSSYRLQGVFAMGSSYMLPKAGTSTGNLYGMAWSHPNAGGVASNLNDHGLLIINNGGFRAAISSRIVASSDVRGTLFYDYNDTGYYVDPNAQHSSNINGVSDRTRAMMGLSGRYSYMRPQITGSTVYWTGNMGWGSYTFNEMLGWGSGFIDSWGSTGAQNRPGDTSHHVGIQTFHWSNGSNAYGWQMIGGVNENLWWRYSWNSPSGWYKIAMYGNNSSTGSFYATIYYDSNNTAYYSDPASQSRLDTILLNEGYNYGWWRNYGSTGLYNQSYGRGIWAAEAGGNSYGNYTTYDSGRNGWAGWGINSRFCYMGRGGDVGLHDNSKGWIWYSATNQLYLYYSAGERASTQSYGFYVNSSFRAGGDARAPIFYDQNDTGYYLDPNTTSNDALRIRGGTLHGPNPSWGAYFRVGTNGRVDGWASVMTTNGNLHLDCRNGYNTYLNWYSGGTVYIENAIQATIMYDRNNTGYYWDGNSTSRMYRTNYDYVYSYNWVYAQADVIAYYSDERLKTKLGNIENALDKISKLNGFYYVNNDLAKSVGYTDEKQQVGLSAQEVQSILPEVVTIAPFDTLFDENEQPIGSKSGENYLTVNYDKIVPLLVEGIKEQNELIKSQQTQLDVQQQQIDELKEMIKSLMK